MTEHLRSSTVLLARAVCAHTVKIDISEFASHVCRCNCRSYRPHAVASAPNSNSQTQPAIYISFGDPCVHKYHCIHPTPVVTLSLISRLFKQPWRHADGQFHYFSLQLIASFYPHDAMLAQYLLSSRVCLSVWPSVCLSVTSQYSNKTAKYRISKITPHENPESLVLWRKRSLKNSDGITPNGGAKCRWGR